VGWSRCGPLSGIVVVGKARVPPFEEVPKRTVKGTRSRLHQQVGASRRPLHLLTLGKRLVMTAFTVDSAKRRSVALGGLRVWRRLANDRGGWENRQCVGVAMTPIEITAEGHR
jgi:hypothetical protein